MEEDTATMTSVTEDLSLDETDTSSSYDIDTSSQITSSDVNGENTTTVDHTPLPHGAVRDGEADIFDISMEVSEQDCVSTVDEDEPVSRPPNARASGRPRHHTKQRSNYNLPWGKGAQIPDLMTVQGRWYEHECFNHYWRHYQYVSMWSQKHMETYKTVLQQFNRATSRQTTVPQRPPNHSQAAPVFKKPISKKTYRNRKARRRRKIAKKRLKGAMKGGEVVERGCTASQSEESDRTGETTESAEEGALKEEEDMEITDEMLDFFAHTHKHKQEREALKKSKDGGKEEKHVNIEESEEKQERTEAAPAERPGSKRTSEMRLLYGKGAAMIHGMETALQMTFDRNMDVVQPSMWPNMPLRVLF